jgi:hypothetical protein
VTIKCGQPSSVSLLWSRALTPSLHTLPARRYVEELEAKLAALDRSHERSAQDSAPDHTSHGTGSGSRIHGNPGGSPMAGGSAGGSPPPSPHSRSSRRVSVDSAALAAQQSVAGARPGFGSGSTHGQPSHEASGSSMHSGSAASSGGRSAYPFGQSQPWEAYPTAPPSSSYSRPDPTSSVASQQPSNLPTVENVTAKLREHPPTAEDGDHDDGPPGLGRAHTDFNPGEDTTSSADGDGEDGDQRKMMGDGGRWERQGRASRSASPCRPILSAKLISLHVCFQSMQVTAATPILLSKAQLGSLASASSRRRHSSRASQSTTSSRRVRALDSPGAGLVRESGTLSDT